MNIDWFTFVAQILNFLVLVALLGRFLYRPIVQAMQQREDDIAQRLDDVEQQRHAADVQRQKYEDLNRQIDEQREQMVRDVRQEVQVERETLISEARRDVQQKRDEWLQGLHREQEELLHELRLQSSNVSVEIARKALQRLADAELEEQMLRRFVVELLALDTKQQNEISGRLSLQDGSVSVNSAFDIPQTWRDRIADSVRSKFGYEGDIQYERNAELICGIEIDAGGYTLGWSIQQVLRQLTHDMVERLRTK